MRKANVMNSGMRRNVDVIMNNVKHIIAETGSGNFHIGTGWLTDKNTVGIPPGNDRPYIDMYTNKTLVYAAFVCVPPEFAKAVRNLPPCDKFRTDYFYRPRPELKKESKYNADKKSDDDISYTMSLMISDGVIGSGCIMNSDIPDNVFTIPSLRVALTAAYAHKIPIRHIAKSCGEWKGDYPIIKHRFLNAHKNTDFEK